MSNRDNSSLAATKRIPKSLGTDAKLFGSYTLTDIIVALLPGVVLLLVMRVLLPSMELAGISVQALTLPIAALGIGIGALFVYLTPAHVSAVTWVSAFIGYHTSDSRATHEEATDETLVEHVHPEANAIERTDGTFVGAISVTPPSMALATDDEWRAKAEAFQEFLNTTVEFPIQIYSTTQPFPVEEYVATYEDRLSDPDVEANPVLQQAITAHIDWYEQELARRQATIRDHYVIVAVRPDEVRFTGSTLTQKLGHLPYLGAFIHAWAGPRVEEERAALQDTLDDRVRKIERGLRGIDGVQARQVEAAHLTDLLADYWNDNDSADGNTSRRLRRTPIVTGPER